MAVLCQGGDPARQRYSEEGLRQKDQAKTKALD